MLRREMLALAIAVPSAWQMPGPRRAAAAHATQGRALPLRATQGRVLPLRASAGGGASEADAALWTLGLAAAAYFSSYASEGYEPHRL